VRRNVQKLRAIRSAGAAGTLVDLLGSSELGLRRSSALGLLDILPNWTEEDLAALERSQRVLLHATVLGMPDLDGPGVGDDADPMLATLLRVAICRTFARTGSHRELAVLRQAARVAEPDMEERLVLETAAECAIILETRLTGHSDRRSLLRGTSGPAATRYNLLRPSVSAPPARSNELIRPGR
jgi:hypothetical protein